jgi:hypothetical protein
MKKRGQGGDLDDPYIFLKRIPEKCQKNSFLWHFSDRRTLHGEQVPQSLPTYLFMKKRGLPLRGSGEFIKKRMGPDFL